MYWEDLRNLYGARVFISIPSSLKVGSQSLEESNVSDPVHLSEVNQAISLKAKPECDPGKLTVAESEEILAQQRREQQAAGMWPQETPVELSSSLQESEINRRLKSGFKSRATKALANPPQTEVFYMQPSKSSESSSIRQVLCQ